MTTFHNTLTEQQALAGVQPPLMSRDDWAAMYDGSLLAMHEALARTNAHTQRALHHTVYRFTVRCTVCIGGTVHVQLYSTNKHLEAGACINCNTNHWASDDLAAFERQLSSDTLELYTNDTVDECC